MPKEEKGTARGLEGLASPLVGRDAALARLRDALEALAAGRGGVVSVVGEAGLGKSRLVAEASASAPAGLYRLEGRAFSYTQPVLYYPWRQVVLEAIGARETEPPEAVRAKLRQAARDLPGGDLSLLETVMAVEGEDSLPALQEAGDVLARRIAEATRGYLRVLARQRPLVLIFDDLHWADPATLDLLVHAAEVALEVPLLLVCALRPDRSAPSWGLPERLRAAAGARYVGLTLEHLGRAQAEELLGNLLGDALPEAVSGHILARAEGNPFFLEEVVRGLIDAGDLVSEAGRWRMARAPGDLTVPDTLLGVLSARIDRLPEPAKQVAQTAAVIGRTFAEPVLEDVLAEANTDLPDHLRTLTREDLVRERAPEPEREYAFKHALTRDAAYGRLLVRRRKALHQRAGKVLERRYEEQLEEYAPVLEMHFRLGEDWLKAAEYAKRAAERARRLYALHDALDHYEVALESLEQLPDAPPDLLVDVLLGWTDAAVLRRLHEVIPARRLMLARVERALTLARPLQDTRRLTRALVAKGNVLSLSGFPGSGFGPLLEAFGLAQGLEDEHLALLPYWAATEIMLSRDPKGAAAQFSEVIALAKKVGNKGIEAHATASRAAALARLGEFAAAREAVEQALAVAPQSGSTIKEADVNILVGAAYYDLGDVDQGLAYSAKGASEAESVGGLECACGGYHSTGMGEIEMRRLADAAQHLDLALSLGRGTAMDAYLPQVRAARAVTDALAGDPARAAPRLEAALREAREVGDDYGTSYVLMALADVTLRLERVNEAEPYVREALQSYRSKGMRPYVLRALKVLAAVLEAQGRSDEAQVARTEAEMLATRLQEAGRRAEGDRA